MSLRFIIDGYNVIRHPSLPGDFPRRSNPPFAALARYIRSQKLCGSLKNNVMIVLDGFAPEGRYDLSAGAVEVIFSEDETADERIKRLVERSPQPRNLVVVSDDREIADFARLRGANPMKVEEFVNPRRNACREREDSNKPGLTNEQVSFINDELRKRWLKE